MNEEHLDRYAHLLVAHGVNLRRNQTLFIRGEVAHRRLVARIAEVAYETGASDVRSRLTDPLLEASLIRRGRREQVELRHDRGTCWYNEIVRTRGAVILLQGDEFPEMWQTLALRHPENYASYTRGAAAAASGLRTHGFNRRLCPCVVAPYPTLAAAQRAYPELADDMAVERLAEQIFRFTHADQENALELATVKDRQLLGRCRALNDLGIREIRAVGGGTDLRVTFSRQARWRGGPLETVSGQRYHPNVPSEEVFTTPDRRGTEGRLVAQRPFRTWGNVLVEGLVLEFRQGRVRDAAARVGQEDLNRWLEHDRGARFLGEFALVGEDSPIARSGRFFDLLLLDENAGSHVALGESLAFALDGGEGMKPEDLAEVGFNSSGIHMDVTFGSSEVTVVATESRHGEVVLLEQGCWTERFLNPEI